MWQFIEVPPLPFGQCSICARHTCGEYTDEHGVKRQKWADVPIELDKGGNLVIGYQCIKSLSDDAGVTVRVVEKVIHNEPSDEHIIRIWRELADRIDEPNEIDPITQMSIDNFVESKKEQPQKRRGRASK